MSHILTSLKHAAIIGFIALAGFSAMALPAHAQIDLTTGAEDVAGQAGFANADLEDVIGSIISALLGFLGIIFLLIIIYAGFLWMTAGGNTDQIAKAKKWLINGVIGLIILLAAYAIVNFVIGALGDAGLAE